MGFFIVRLGNGRYISRCLITTNCLNYDSVRAREEAFPMTDFDSALVLKRLKLKGQHATRYEVELEHPQIDLMSASIRMQHRELRDAALSRVQTDISMNSV